MQALAKALPTLLLSFFCFAMANPLLTQRAELQARLRDARKERAMLGRASRSANNLASQWQIPEEDVMISVVIYCMCDYDAAASTQFLSVLGKRRCWKPMSIEFAERVVEDAFLRIDLADLMECLKDVSNKLHVVASRWAGEWRVVDWIKRANAEHGVAPSGVAIMAKAKHTMYSSLPPSALSVDENGRPSSQARAWLTRFRRRWNCRVGRVHIEEQIESSEAQSKALRPCFPRCGVVGVSSRWEGEEYPCACHVERRVCVRCGLRAMHASAR